MRAAAVLDSVTEGSGHVGAVVLAASHGGRITAARAVEGGWAAVIAHNASVGMGAAGVESLSLLDQAGVAAATVGGAAALIGDGRACYTHGRLTHVNEAARAAGLCPGQTVLDALAKLTIADLPEPTRIEITLPPPICIDLGTTRPVWLLGSASEVDPERHRQAVVVTGSHAELLGGRPETALKAAVWAAVFNDAGSTTCSRLPVLAERGIAAVAVGADTARIGDARSALATGRISVVNERAAELGAEAGQPLRDWLQRA